VSRRTTEESSDSKRLRAEYKGAFDEWALQVRRLRAITSSAPDSFVGKDAEARVAAAEAAYRDTRDKLTNDMVVDAAKTASCQ